MSRWLGALQLPAGWSVVVASPSPRQADRSPRSSSRSHPDASTLSSVTHCPAGSRAALGAAPTVSSPHLPSCVRAPVPPHDMLSGFDHVDPTPVVSAWGWRVCGPPGVCRRRPPHLREGRRSPLYAVDSLPPPFSHVYRGLTRRAGGCWLAQGPDPLKRRGSLFFLEGWGEWRRRKTLLRATPREPLDSPPTSPGRRGPYFWAQHPPPPNFPARLCRLRPEDDGILAKRRPPVAPFSPPHARPPDPSRDEPALSTTADALRRRNPAPFPHQAGVEGGSSPFSFCMRLRV